MAENMNETILKMVRTMKSSTMRELALFTPVKRPLGLRSEDSVDGPEKRPRLDLTSQKRPHLTTVRQADDVPYLGSPREVRRLRADLVEARNNVKMLESRVGQMHSLSKQTQLVFEEETHQLKRQQEYDRKTIEELEQQLQEIRRREVALKSELCEERSKSAHLKLQSDSSVIELEKTLSQINQESQYTEIMENTEINQLKRQVEQLETILQAARDDLTAQKQLVREMEKQLVDQTEIGTKLEMRDNELQQMRLSVKELEFAKLTNQEHQDLIRTQAHKLLHYPELEKDASRLRQENAKLKDQVRHKLVLEEECHDLKQRLLKFKALEKAHADLQVQSTRNAVDLNEWRNVARVLCESSADSDAELPFKLRQEVEKLQQRELMLTASKVELESQLKDAVHELKAARSELAKCSKQLANAKQTGDQKQLLIHRIQKKLQLISRERDSYRLQLDSYEKDLTVNISSGSTSNQMQTAKDKMQRLEQINEGYKDLISKYEADWEKLQQSGTNPNSEGSNNTKLEDELVQVKNQLAKLRDRNDHLEVQLEHLAQNGGREKVYHLSERNPLQQCLKQRQTLMDNLEKDNERLRRKIKQLEDGVETTQTTDGTTMSVKQMTDLVRTQEGQIKILKDYFQDFRNMIYILLGYKVDKCGSSLYKLRNVYAETENDVLCFEINAEGELKLLQNDYSSNLEHLINLHLRQQNSFPCFMSAITMDLFNSKTKTYVHNASSSLSSAS